MGYKTIKVRFEAPICFIQLYRPQANNAINACLIKECMEVLDQCEDSVTIIVLEGLPEVFCSGADFDEIVEAQSFDNTDMDTTGEGLYKLWTRLNSDAFVSIAHVKGKVNAGGVGFASACDIVIADKTVQFSLSEMIFGLIPACVMPFLIRRIGYQRARYLALSTQPIPVQQAEQWGLVDAFGEKSEIVLRKHLLRLRRLSKKGIRHLKQYMNNIDDFFEKTSTNAINSNKEIFSDKDNINNIKRYIKEGKFPWDK